MTRTEEQPINKQSVIKKYKELVEQYLATIDDVEEYDFSKAPNIAKIAVYILCKIADNDSEFSKYPKNSYVLPMIDHAHIVEQLEKSGIYKFDKEETLRRINEIFDELSSVKTDDGLGEILFEAILRERLGEFFVFNKDDSIKELNCPLTTPNLNFDDLNVRKQINDVKALRKTPTEQLVQTWKYLAENDCILGFSYYRNQLVKKGTRDLDEIEDLISEAIKFLSARKICSIFKSCYEHVNVNGINKSENDVENDYFESSINKLTSELTRCQTENIKDNGVGVRDRNCPLIIFNKIFYADILRIGTDGYNLVPSLENLKPKDIFNDELYREEEKQEEK